MDDFIYPEDVDRYLNWPLGMAARLARRRRLPHYRLPDNSIRFRLEDVKALVRHVPVTAGGEAATIRLCAAARRDPEEVTVD